MDNKEVYLIVLSAVTTIYMFIRRFIKNIVTFNFSTKTIDFKFKRGKNDKDKSN